VERDKEVNQIMFKDRSFLLV